MSAAAWIALGLAALVVNFIVAAAIGRFLRRRARPR